MPTGPVLVVVVVIAASIYIGKAVGKELHKFGCKIHIAHCEPKQPTNPSIILIDK